MIRRNKNSRYTVGLCGMHLLERTLRGLSKVLDQKIKYSFPVSCSVSGNHSCERIPRFASTVRGYYQVLIFDRIFYESLRSLSVTLYAIESCWMDLLKFLNFRVEPHGFSKNDLPQALKMASIPSHLDLNLVR